MNPLSDLERLVAAIEKQGANIAPTYQEYMPLAFAIANDCGEAGRSLFHRICRISEKYVSDEADRLFDHALKGGNGRNGIGSGYHWAGVKLDKQLAGTARSYAGKQPETCELANLQPSHPLTHTCAHEAYINMPVFGNYDWPPFLNQLIDCGDSPAQRDILLLGAVTVLGATLNKHLRILYGRKYHYPCLQTFIVAPPASGKGALTWVRHLAEPIHEAMMEEFKSLRKEYRLEKARWGSLGKERAKTPEPEEPRPKMFLIAGDNSGTGVLENLIEADGVGLICETEADTVSTAIGTDYGHWSDTLRKCYDHDRLAFNRRMNHEYLECMKSFLSVLLSGTPAQVKPLIPSAENGLFSRQLFYRMPPIDEWADQFEQGDEDMDSLFSDWGKQWKMLVDYLRERVNIIQFHLSDTQKERFNSCFARIFGHAGLSYGYPMRSSVARIAINICRIASVVAFLRSVESLLIPQAILDSQFSILNCPGLSPALEIPEENVRDGIVPSLELRINDDDFKAVLSLVEPLYRHSAGILSLLPSDEVPRSRTPTPQEALFAALPLSFNRQQALEEAERNNIPTATLDTCLKRMQERGTLEKNGRGEYSFGGRVTHK